MPKNEARLQEVLGTDKASWNNNCLVPYPREFDKQIDLIAEEVQIAQSDPVRAKEIVRCQLICLSESMAGFNGR